MSESELFCDFTILRELRRREGLSIAELAERSSVSASVISKLERNQSRAEMDTLYRIARVFGITLSELIALAEGRTAQRVDERDYAAGGFHFRRIRYGNISVFFAQAAQGTRHHRPEAHRDSFELCWVLSGRVRIELPKEVHELSGGMSLQFDALLPHNYEVLEDCALVMTHIRKDKRF